MDPAAVNRLVGRGGEDSVPFNQIPPTPKFRRTASRTIVLSSFRGKGSFEQLVRDSGRPTG